MNKPKNVLHHAIDVRLSGLTLSRRTQEELLRRAQEEDVPVKKKISVALVFAAVLLLALAATACAAALRFGMLDYNPNQQGNASYTDHILALDKKIETAYFTVQLNDAVFDGSALSLTMDITPREGAQAVYVKPVISAISGETILDVDIEGCTGGDFYSGFWISPTTPSVNDGQYGVDCAILSEDEMSPAVQESAVIWDIRFDVLRPEYPVSIAPECDDGNASAAQGWANGQILLPSDGSLIEFDAMLPAPQGFDEEAWNAQPLIHRLVTSGAFSLVDSCSCSFSTSETRVQTAPKQTFDIGDYAVTLESLHVTFSRANYALSVRSKPGAAKSARDEYLAGDWKNREFCVLAPGCETRLMGISSYAGKEGDEAIYFSGTISLSNTADTLTFALCIGSNASEAMFNQQLTPEQEALSFTVPLKTE